MAIHKEDVYRRLLSAGNGLGFALDAIESGQIERGTAILRLVLAHTSEYVEYLCVKHPEWKALEDSMTIYNEWDKNLVDINEPEE